MVIRLQSCMRSSTHLLPSTPPLPAFFPHRLHLHLHLISRQKYLDSVGDDQAGAEDYRERLAKAVEAGTVRAPRGGERLDERDVEQ